MQQCDKCLSSKHVEIHGESGQFWYHCPSCDWTFGDDQVSMTFSGTHDESAEAIFELNVNGSIGRCYVSKELWNSVHDKAWGVKSPSNRMKWNLEGAVQFIKELKDHMSPHYSVGITGSVLFEGSSSNDLDIIIYPKTTMHFKLGEVRELLEAFGLELKVNFRDTQKKWLKHHSSNDEKIVEKYKFKRKRVNVFYLGIGVNDLLDIDVKYTE